MMLLTLLNPRNLILAIVVMIFGFLAFSIVRLTTVNADLRVQVVDLDRVKAVAQENAEKAVQLQESLEKSNRIIATLQQEKEKLEANQKRVLRGVNSARHTSKDGPIAPVVSDALKQLYPAEAGSDPEARTGRPSGSGEPSSVQGAPAVAGSANPG